MYLFILIGLQNPNDQSAEDFTINNNHDSYTTFKKRESFISHKILLNILLDIYI